MPQSSRLARATPRAAPRTSPGTADGPRLNLPRLIVSDLDGTLLPESKELTPYTQQVFAELQARGVRVGLATGKFLHLTAPYGEALGEHTALIALDGARVGHVRGNGHRVSGIRADRVLEVLERYQDAAHNLFLDSGNDELVLRHRDEDFPHVIRHWATQRRRVDDLRGHVVGASGIVALYGEQQVMREIAHTAAYDYPDVKVSYFDTMLYGGGRVTFQPGGVTKATGLGWLREQLGVAAEETMVFGDWYNDIPLFQAGCVNVAMDNAVPEVRALARHGTAEDCEHDGVARFLAGHFLDN
ncbi:MAG: HAD-IIB family hydrolase [Candidatus Lambdaproteobacteria bacterium]|nr:HAD-IIB family hydrolase [Candidatus Lambdaproteobacteria bacterium]